ncbi:hypothetical protein EDD21DRAFT_164551 [Dissophora ornata]|nr:hypothetical protein EDD21DRAFT_164551 [Dissophora ornata]
MTTRNQTQLGFAQQKTGARRILHSKHCKATTGVDGNAEVEAVQNKNTSPPSPEELLLERAGNLVRTVEQKLATYRKEKEERITRDIEQAADGRSSRSKTSGQELKNNDAATQRTLRSASKTKAATRKTQTLIDFQRISTKKKNTGDNEDSATDQAKKIAETLMEEEIGKVAEKMSEEATEVIAPETRKDSEGEETLLMAAVEESNDSAASKEPSQSTAHMRAGKPIAKDTIMHSNDSHSNSNDEDEDNIHPLARTVVKALPRTNLRKAHIEESSSTHHKVEARKSISIPSVISHKPTVQEPTLQTPLPLPSHMSALCANFKGLETVLMFTKRQGQLCFYHRLKKHVELQSSR